jgi:hypothetical protein
VSIPHTTPAETQTVAGSAEATLVAVLIFALRSTKVHGRSRQQICTNMQWLRLFRVASVVFLTDTIDGM